MKMTRFSGALCVSAMLLLVACGGRSAGTNGGPDGGSGQGRERQKATNDEVMAAYAGLLQAFEKKDVNALDRMFSPRSTVVAPPLAGRVMIWSDARPLVEQSLKASSELHISRSDNGVVGVDRDMGWIANAYHIREVTPKGPSESDGIMTVVFQKTEEGYKVLAFHAGRPPGVPVAAPSAPATPARK